jgi:riboflavin synthase
MFTGLIEKKARIKSRDISSGAGKLELFTETPFTDLKRGESIAVNGACLTLETFNKNDLVFHVLEETFSKTNLGILGIGSWVNLERSLTAGSRIGGHLVTGHIDTAAAVESLIPAGDDWELSISLPDELLPYIVKKGSIAIDGVSLTVVKLEGNIFSVHLIPVTCQDTCLPEREAGQMVNLEVDIIGKYVVRQLSVRQENAGSDITMEMLEKSGW